MANANPTELGKVSEPVKVVKPKGVKKVESWAEIKDSKTGKNKPGSYELPSGTIVTMN